MMPVGLQLMTHTVWSG